MKKFTIILVLLVILSACSIKKTISLKELVNDYIEENNINNTLYETLMIGTNYNNYKPIITIGANDDWIKLDSNPDNIKSSTSLLSNNNSIIDLDYKIFKLFNDMLLEKLEFSDLVKTQQESTSALMGVQTAESDIATASWTYHPDNGLEVIYKLK